MNVWPLQPQPPLNATVIEKDGGEKDASDFLSFRLLNKRARVRISPEGHDLKPLPGKAQLLVVANSKGWFTAVVRASGGQTLIACSPLSGLRDAFASTSHNEDNEIILNPKRTVSLSSAIVDFLVVAANDSRLLVSVFQGPILVYDTASLFREGSDQVHPIHQFPPTVPTAVRHIVANPGDLPELVAVVREPDGKPNSQLVDMMDVVKLQSAGGWKWLGTPESTPTALSWSPKGKQLAIGLENGVIYTFSPTAPSQVKSKIPKAPSAPVPSVLHATWLTNPSFHVIYAVPGTRIPTDADTSHWITSMDSKTNTGTCIRLHQPCFPFPGNRPPSAFMCVLRGWEPTKFLMVMGDSVSSDIGVTACLPDSLSPAQESWYHLTMDETGTPSMPLDKEMNDTVLVGLEIDFTNTDAFRSTNASGEQFETPPPPIVLAYASDGTIQAWFLVNSSGPSYPGMIIPSAAPAAAPAPPTLSAPPISRDTSMDTATPSTPTATGFGQVPQAQSAFGQVSPLGQQSQTQPAFGQTTAFGQFTNNTPSAFGPPSGFGGGSVFRQSSSPPAFGAEAGDSQGKFGQTGFGFGSGPSLSSSAAVPPPVAASASLPDTSMSSDADEALGGLSLGSGHSSDADKKPSIFGSVSSPTVLQQASSNNQSGSSTSAFSSGTNAFSSFKPSVGFGAFSNVGSSPPAFSSPPQTSAVAKPAQGFGAFSNFGSQQAAPPTPSTSSEPSKPSSAFGSSGFGSNPTASSGFGQPSTLGQTSAFGKLAASPSPAPPSTGVLGSGGGDFAAFAQNGLNSFGSTLKQSESPSGSAFEPAKSESLSTTIPSALGTASASPSASGTTSPSPPVFGQPSLATHSTPRSPVEDKQRSEKTPASGKFILASPPPSPLKENATPSTSVPASQSSGGAFGQLKTSPSSFIKPGQGFGMGVTSDSPFMQPKKPGEGFVALSQPSGSTTPSKPAGTPAFGAPSPLGGAKSVFGQSSFSGSTTPINTPSKSVATPSSAVTTSAFSAFSGGSSGFGALAGSNKSFSTMLREGKEGSPTPKQSVSVFDTAEKRASKDISDASTPAQKPAETSSPGLHTPSVSGEDGDTDEEEDASKTSGRLLSEEALGNQELLSLSDLTKEPSVDVLSLSRDSSFVEVVEPSEDEDHQEEKFTAHGRDDESEEDAVSFLSEDFSEEAAEEDEVSEEGEEEEGGVGKEEGGEEEGEEESQDPVPRTSTPVLPATPKPQSRSPSTTPKPDVPIRKSSPSPITPVIVKDDAPPFIVAPKASTTPTGSPVKEPPLNALSSQAILAAPIPVSTSTPSAQFALGLGKPSTRPARSSPLAKPPTTPEDETDNASKIPAPAFGLKPQSPIPPLTARSPAPTEPGSKDPRPKTPPLTSLFGPPSKPPSVLPGFSLNLSAQSASSPGYLNLPSGPLSPAAASPKPGSPAPAAPIGVGFSSKPALSTFPVSGPASPTKAAIPESGESPVAKGMQAECLHLFETIAKELEDLRKLSLEVKAKTVGMNQPVSIRPGEVTLGDVRRLKQKTLEMNEDVEGLKMRKRTYNQAIRELENNLLKATTKREEIVRFSRASTDPEFAKALRIRSLGPEYTETQSQLRRNIRALRDRIEKLEDHIKSSKKRVREYRTGKPALRAPTLDSIRKTYHNIDTVLDQQAADLADLADRVADLKLDKRSSRRLPADVSHVRDVTPEVAGTTAAALNAERSAQKLKRALLAARKEPLLNRQAVGVAAPKSLIDSPKPAKEETVWPAPADIPAPSRPDLLSLGPPPALPSAPVTLPEFSLPPLDDASQTHGHGGRQRSIKYHMKSAPLKKSQTPSPSASPATAKVASASAGPPVAFDWGPLPGVKPMSTLSADVRPQREKEKSPQPGVEGSWVLNGFGDR